MQHEKAKRIQELYTVVVRSQQIIGMIEESEVKGEPLHLRVSGYTKEFDLPDNLVSEIKRHYRKVRDAANDEIENFE